MFDWLRRLLFGTREQRLLREQGFLVFCHGCHTLLNDGAAPEAPRGQDYLGRSVDGTYRYTCPKCGKRTVFDLTAPVPLKVGDA
jgi:hypothetical protein